MKSRFNLRYRLACWIFKRMSLRIYSNNNQKLIISADVDILQAMNEFTSGVKNPLVVYIENVVLHLTFE